MKRIPKVISVVAVLVAAVAIWAFVKLRESDQDEKADAIRKQGYPITLSELNEWYKRVPDDENAAYIYTNAFYQIRLASNAFSWITEDSWIPKRGHAIEESNRVERLLILSTNQEPMTLLYAGAALTNSRYPLDMRLGFDLPLPHLADVKRAVQILTGQALLLASGGENEKAVEALAAAARVSDSMREEPVLISQLVHIAAWRIICNRLELILNETKFTPDQLSRLQKLIADGEEAQFSRGLVGERADGHAIFTDVRSQNLFFDSSTPSTQNQMLRNQFLIGIYKATGLYRKDRNFYLDAMGKLISTAELPYPDRFTVSQSSPLPSPPGKFYIVSRMMLPALSKAISKDAQRVACLRVTKTALAVERFRRVNSDRLPDSLDKLVPDFLDAVPTDPFDGKPLRFKTRESGYVVYSIGTDLRDDGGVEYDKKKTSNPSDITFILEH